MLHMGYKVGQRRGEGTLPREVGDGGTMSAQDGPSGREAGQTWLKAEEGF